MPIFGREKKETDVIDLSEAEAVPEPVVQRPQWGQPTACPSCGSGGYLDHVDLRARTMEQHCVECGHKWLTHESEFSSAD